MPSKKDYPSYYKQIKRPMCLEYIFVCLGPHPRAAVLTLDTETVEAQGIYYLRGVRQRCRTSVLKCTRIQSRSQPNMGGCLYPSGWSAFCCNVTKTHSRHRTISAKSCLIYHRRMLFLGMRKRQVKSSSESPVRRQAQRPLRSCRRIARVRSLHRTLQVP